MQAKGAAILIRDPRMRDLCVQHLEDAIDVILAVEEADARIGEERVPVLCPA